MSDFAYVAAVFVIGAAWGSSTAAIILYWFLIRQQAELIDLITTGTAFRETGE